MTLDQVLKEKGELVNQLMADFDKFCPECSRDQRIILQFKLSLMDLEDLKLLASQLPTGK